MLNMDYMNGSLLSYKDLLRQSVHKLYLVWAKRFIMETYLHGHGEVILGFWREEHIYCFLWKWLVASWWGPHFNDVQLSQREKT